MIDGKQAHDSAIYKYTSFTFHTGSHVKGLTIFCSTVITEDKTQLYIWMLNPEQSEEILHLLRSTNPFQMALCYLIIEEDKYKKRQTDRHPGKDLN